MPDCAVRAVRACSAGACRLQKSASLPLIADQGICCANGMSPAKPREAGGGVAAARCQSADSVVPLLWELRARRRAKLRASQVLR